jgi:hypothetical protein
MGTSQYSKSVLPYTIRNFPSYFSDIHSDILSIPKSSEWSLTFRFSNQNFVFISHPPHACYIPRPAGYSASLLCRVLHYIGSLMPIFENALVDPIVDDDDDDDNDKPINRT